jgi:hypothetical protein
MPRGGGGGGAEKGEIGLLIYGPFVSGRNESSPSQLN